MALQTANNFQLVPDIGGAVSRGIGTGIGLRQANERTDLLGEQKAQRTQTEALQGAANAAVKAQNLPDDISRVNFLKQRVQDVSGRGGDASDTQEVLSLFESNQPEQANALLKSFVDTSIQTGLINAAPQSKDASFTLGAGQKRFGPDGKLIAEVSTADKNNDKDFTLGKGQQRFGAKGNLIAGSADVSEQPKIPPVLLEGLDPTLAPQAEAAFTAAGGGKDGLKAFQNIVDKGTEQQRRLASPAIIKSSFPQASSAETVQLQSAMDAAKTTEAGLKAAGKVREEQRRTKKAQAFQTRAIELIDKILVNDELGDVLGSVEGAIDFRLQDSEAELIADIEETGNILTADNLNLMSGVLSESDIKILKNLAGGGLIRTRSKERFTSDVGKIREKLASQIIVTIDEEKALRDKNIELQEGQVINNKQTGQRMQVVNGQLVEIK